MKPLVKKTTAILSYRLSGSDRIISHEYNPNQRKMLYKAQDDIHKHNIDYMVVSFKDIK